MHWYKQLKPFSHYDRFNNSINTAYIETTNNTDNNQQVPSPENDMPNYYSDSIDGIGERIAELHRNIAILRRPGETRKKQKNRSYNTLPPHAGRTEKN